MLAVAVMRGDRHLLPSWNPKLEI